MTHFVIAENADIDVAEGVGRTARVGIVGKAVLGAEFAVDLIEDDAEVGSGVREEHGATRGFRDCLQGMFTSGIAAAFVFYGADQNRIEQRVGADGRLSRGFEIGTARRFAAVGNENDNGAGFTPLRGEAFLGGGYGVAKWNARAVTG